MMSASPEFYKPSSAPAFSPPLLFATAGEGAEDYYFRTPTGAGISYLGEPDACPPAPRKPRPPPAACRKRLFEAVSLRLDDLERIFQCDKRRRSPDSKAARTTSDELISNPPVVSRH